MLGRDGSDGDRAPAGEAAVLHSALGALGAAHDPGALPVLSYIPYTIYDIHYILYAYYMYGGPGWAHGILRGRSHEAAQGHDEEDRPERLELHDERGRLSACVRGVFPKAAGHFEMATGKRKGCRRCGRSRPWLSGAKTRLCLL